MTDAAPDPTPRPRADAETGEGGARPAIRELGRGGPRPRFDGVRRIAVLRAGGLGDLVLTVPAMRALAAAYPDAELTLLGAPLGAALFAGRPGGPDRVVPLPPVPGVGAPEGSAADRGEIERFLAERRAEGFDLAVQLHGGGRFSNPFLLELGARYTVGTRTPDAAPLDRALDYVYYQHEVFRWLEVAGLAGAPPVEIEPRVEATEEERAFGAGLRRGARALVAVHPGATDPRRRWPVERFAEVGAELARAGARVLVVGSAEERELCGRVAEAARARLGGTAADDRVEDLSAGLSLSELAGALAEADLLVGNDSGPRHLAQALGTRTAAVYWCGNLLNAGPLGRERHRVQVSWITRCPVCGRDSSQVGWTAERCEHDDSFVGDVSAASVLEDARALLGW